MFRNTPNLAVSSQVGHTQAPRSIRGSRSAALLRYGYSVLIPFGVSRYDLVIDTPAGFKRVQCKTARLLRSTESIQFNVCSNPPGGTTRNYDGQIDYFGVYSPDLDRVYLVPIEAVVGIQRGVNLRLRPSSSQRNGTRLAETYRLVAQSERALVS